MTASPTVLQAVESAIGPSSALSILERDGLTKIDLGELLERARRLSSVLTASGVEPGDRVAIVGHTSPQFIAGVFSIWYAGAVTVPLASPPRSVFRRGWEGQTQRLLAKCRPKAILGDELGPLTELTPISLDPRLPKTAPDTNALVTADDPAVVQFTSGSTAFPKGVVLTHRAILAQFEGRQTKLALDPSHDHCVGWVPLYHDQGLMAMFLYPLVVGVPTTLIAPSTFIQDPLVWLTTISRVRGTYTAGPNFAYALAARYLRRKAPRDLDLSGWDLALNGGEVIDPDVLVSFCEDATRFGFKPQFFTPGFGLAENVLAVATRSRGQGYKLDVVERESLGAGNPQPARAEDRSVRMVSLGTPLPYTEIRIVDPDGNVLPERHIGEIQIKSRSLMREYFDDPAGTDAAFTDGWLRIGDRGYVVDGEAYITGRDKNVIIVRGRNLAAEDIEIVVQRVAGIRKGNCAAFAVKKNGKEEIGIAAETRLEDPVAQERLRRDVVREVWQEFGVSPHLVELLPPRSLPKTTSGKLQRNLVRDRFGQ